MGVGCLSTCPQQYCNPVLHEGRGEKQREKGREKMRTGERKREGKRERDGQTKNKQRDTCRQWNKPKRCPEKKKAINQIKHNHKKFQKLALTTFFLRRQPPLLEVAPLHWQRFVVS